MPELKFTHLPTKEELSQAISQAMSTANPVDDLLELSVRLHEFEQKYGLSSIEFFQKYQAGELPEPLQHCIEWAALYDLFTKTKRVLEATLMRAAIQPEMIV
jgi:tRNA U34 2-thiouridine synthase MnmA/TrmU